MKVQLDQSAYMPDREHPEDAGADLKTPERFILRARSHRTIDTGIHVEIPPKMVGMVKSKSGLMCEGVVTDGTVDSGYSGSIKVCLFNHSGKHIEFEKGDKIAQLVILPVETPDFEQVSEITGGERGNNGFGSTGR